jgi:hypothetical protein
MTYWPDQNTFRDAVLAGSNHFSRCRIGRIRSLSETRDASNYSEGLPSPSSVIVPRALPLQVKAAAAKFGITPELMQVTPEGCQIIRWRLYSELVML